MLTFLIGDCQKDPMSGHLLGSIISISKTVDGKINGTYTGKYDFVLLSNNKATMVYTLDNHFTDTLHLVFDSKDVMFSTNDMFTFRFVRKQ